MTAKTPIQVLMGERALSEHAQGEGRRPVINNQERVILGLLVKGLKNKEIAARMGLPGAMVQDCLQNLFQKLGVADPLELVFFVVANNLVPLDPDQMEG